MFSVDLQTAKIEKNYEYGACGAAAKNNGTQSAVDGFFLSAAQKENTNLEIDAGERERERERQR